MNKKPIRDGKEKVASRMYKAKRNITTSLLTQIVSMVCGLIVPRLMIETFGSELNGAATSIAHFLAYISLIEGGVAGVARAALYKPLAKCDVKDISNVYHEIMSFFRTIGFVFIIYTILLASTYKYIAKNTNLEWLFSAILVLVISISTLGQYFLGVSNSILLQADQKNYIINSLSTISILINTVLIVFLTRIGCNIIVVKLASSIVFVIKPLVLALYVRNKYRILPAKECDKTGALSQKWTALGQHLAYFLHTNTDVAVLTILVDLKTVSVYSVYYMIVSNIRGLASASYNGLESILGDMYARGEIDNLNKVFGYYETLISIISISLFATTEVLFIPFIKLYTSGVTDVNYIVPNFALISVLAELVYILRTPYHYMSNAASRFKQTKMAAYGEALINIVLSIALVFQFGIIGVALATLVATLFRSIFYALYISKHVLNRKIELYIKRNLVNAGTFIVILFVGEGILSMTTTNTYLSWALCGCMMTIISIGVTFLSNMFFYWNDVKEIVKRIGNR